MPKSKTSSNTHDFLSPENLRSVKGLELLARSTVSGLLPGIHKSYQLGAGQEFSQYRSYQPGDDLRRLDWKLYARSDRFYVREASIESNITIHFVIDASASMRHEDSGIGKIDFARYLVATLAWLASQYGDAVGLYGISGGNYYRLHPKPGRQFLQRFLYELVKIDGQGQFPESLNQQYFPPASSKKEMVIFISDFYQQNKELDQAVTTLKQGNREVLLFHLMGKNELEMDYKSAMTFEDLETGQTVQMNSPKIRKQYLGQLQDRLKAIQQEALSKGMEYHLFRMDEPIGRALKTFLKRRV